MTPEQHLHVGIAAHEANQLAKSTYHLRLAAHAGLPTGMLLYALACRHGWGMRANQSVGVAWLRKAVDCAGVELASTATTIAATAAATEPSSLQALLAHKAHTASLALAIYELGQCYMNGWGMTLDRCAGLRSFEIAGAMGDRDAIAEAAFCYAKGVGCKKNLQKSAELYRKAEAMGVEVVGESWFRKEKYGGNEKKVGGEKEKEKSRGLFGRRKEKERAV
jgi:TPR repeat protein